MRQYELTFMKEEMSRPKLTREEILYWFYKFRKLNPKKLDHRRTLINNFVNSVFLFEDRMVITFNFKDGTETITFADLEKSALGSDFKVSGAPLKKPYISVFMLICKAFLFCVFAVFLTFFKHSLLSNITDIDFANLFL